MNLIKRFANPINPIKRFGAEKPNTDYPVKRFEPKSTLGLVFISLRSVILEEKSHPDITELLWEQASHQLGVGLEWGAPHREGSL